MAKPNPLSQGLNKQARPVAPVLASVTTPAPDAQPAAKAAARPGRTGRVLLGGHFSREVQTELKVLAAKERCTIQELIAEGIDAVFARRHLPQIASLTPNEPQDE